MPDPQAPKRVPISPTLRKPDGLRRPSVCYAELHCCTNFSFLEGASHPDELVAQAAELGYAALAITDRASLAGVVRAYEAVKKAKETGKAELKADHRRGHRSRSTRPPCSCGRPIGRLMAGWPRC